MKFLLILVALIIFVLVLTTFFHHFFWKYYAGPVVADAKGHPVDGIHEGYNPVSTLTYGAVLACCIYAVFNLFIFLGIPLDRRVIIATIPYIVAGSSSRVLEDAYYFREPVVYIFIAPDIYIFVGVVCIVCLIVSHRIWKMKKRKMAKILHAVALLILAVSIMPFYFADSTAGAVTFITVAIISILICSKKKVRHYSTIMYNLGVLFMSAPLIQISYIYATSQFQHPLDFFAIVSLALSATIPIIIFIKYSASSNRKILPLSRFPSSLIIFSHMLDASATFWGLQFYSYGEKHVFPSFLIALTGTPAVMFPLKIFFILLILYIIEVDMRHELKKWKNAHQIIRIALIVLGLSPGLRDTLRIACGV